MGWMKVFASAATVAMATTCAIPASAQRTLPTPVPGGPRVALSTLDAGVCQFWPGESLQLVAGRVAPQGNGARLAYAAADEDIGLRAEDFFVNDPNRLLNNGGTFEVLIGVVNDRPRVTYAYRNGESLNTLMRFEDPRFSVQNSSQYWAVIVQNSPGNSERQLFGLCLRGTASSVQEFAARQGRLAQ